MKKLLIAFISFILVISLAAPVLAADFTYSATKPTPAGTKLFDLVADQDNLTGFDAKGGIGVDLFNLAKGGGSYCLKRDTSAWYEFTVPSASEITFVVEYIARTGAQRGLDYSVNDPKGEKRVFMDLEESNDKLFVTGKFTVEGGTHNFYLYAPTAMDDSALKSCDVYSVALYYMALPETAAAATTAAAAAAEAAPAKAAQTADIAIAASIISLCGAAYVIIRKR